MTPALKAPPLQPQLSGSSSPSQPAIAQNSRLEPVLSTSAPAPRLQNANVAIDLTFTHETDMGEADTIVAALRSMGDAVDKILGDRYGTALGSLAVVVTADLGAIVQDRVDALGLPGRQATLAQTIGTVAGKTLVDHQQRPVAVVALRDPAWVTFHPTLMTVAHELGHVIELSAAAVFGSNDDGPRTLAETDAALGLSMASEFRAERIGADLSKHFATADASTGDALDVWASRRNGLVAGLDGILDQVVPAVPTAVASLRQGAFAGFDVDLWVDVMERLVGAFTYLGYLEGSNPGDALTAASAHPGASLLRPFWEPMREHLAANDPAPAGGYWADDRARLAQIARDGIETVYRSLGVERIQVDAENYRVAFHDPTWSP